MFISIKISKITVNTFNIMNDFLKFTEKYLLIICIKIFKKIVNKGDYYSKTI